MPPSVAALQSGDTRVQDARDDAAKIRDATQLVEFLRPLIQTMFLQLRITRIEEFLQPYVARNDPDFRNIRDDIADQITEARGIPQDEWRQAAPEVAIEILHTAGQLFDEPWEPSDRQLDWFAIRDLLLAPQAEAVVQGMIAARAG